MKATTAFQLEAPWLQHKPAHTQAALGAAVWLWMHDLGHRKEALSEMEHRLLAPIEAGQYVIARPSATSSTSIEPAAHAWALLLFARFDEQAESRYQTAPSQRIAIRDWRSGDRLWLIDWTAPFGHTSVLREPVMALLAGHGAQSLCRPGRGSDNRVRSWQRPLSNKATAPQACADIKEPAHW